MTTNNLLTAAEEYTRLGYTVIPSQALQAILVEYEDLELAEIDHRIPYAGYFYVDNRIVGYDITQAPFTKDDMLAGIDTLEELYRRSKDKDILITVPKVGTSCTLQLC